MAMFLTGFILIDFLQIESAPEWGIAACKMQAYSSMTRVYYDNVEISEKVSPPGSFAAGYTTKYVSVELVPGAYLVMGTLGYSSTGSKECTSVGFLFECSDLGLHVNKTEMQVYGSVNPPSTEYETGKGDESSWVASSCDSTYNYIDGSASSTTSNKYDKYDLIDGTTTKARWCSKKYCTWRIKLLDGTTRPGSTTTTTTGMTIVSGTKVFTGMVTVTTSTALDGSNDATLNGLAQGMAKSIGGDVTADNVTIVSITAMRRLGNSSFLPPRDIVERQLSASSTIIYRIIVLSNSSLTSAAIQAAQATFPSEATTALSSAGVSVTVSAAAFSVPSMIMYGGEGSSSSSIVSLTETSGVVILSLCILFGVIILWLIAMKLYIVHKHMKLKKLYERPELKIPYHLPDWMLDPENKDSLFGLEWNMDKLLQPPKKITEKDGTELRDLLTNLALHIGKPKDYLPEVFVIHTTGKRAKDAHNTGPGTFYAAAVIRLLFAYGVPCFSTLLVPEAKKAKMHRMGTKGFYKTKSNLTLGSDNKNNRKSRLRSTMNNVHLPNVFHHEHDPQHVLMSELNCKEAICKVVVVIETEELYHDPRCLTAIHAALQRKPPPIIMLLKFQSGLPECNAQWAEIK
jgi:hypothetical protein